MGTLLIFVWVSLLVVALFFLHRTAPLRPVAASVPAVGAVGLRRSRRPGRSSQPGRAAVAGGGRLSRPARSAPGRPAVEPAGRSSRRRARTARPRRTAIDRRRARPVERRGDGAADGRAAPRSTDRAQGHWEALQGNRTTGVYLPPAYPVGVPPSEYARINADYSRQTDRAVTCQGIVKPRLTGGSCIPRRYR